MNLHSITAKARVLMNGALSCHPNLAIGKSYHPCFCQTRARTPHKSDTTMPIFIIALKPKPSKSASTRLLKPCASFARGKGVFLGISLPRNAHRGAHPSSIFHSRSRSGGTISRIMATCSLWMRLPSDTPSRRDLYDGDLKRQGHNTR